MFRKNTFGYFLFFLIFVSFVIFLYGPIFSIILLSFQGPEGGLVFPLQGFSIHWFKELWNGSGLVDIGASFRRSIALGFLVMLLTVTLSVAAGLAFRHNFFGANILFYVAVASLIVPSIVLSLGIALEFRIIDNIILWIGKSLEIKQIEDNFQTSLGMYSSGFGAQLTWTLPFGLLIMFAIFNRFDKSFEEAAKDLGASSYQTFRYVVFPIILPSIIGIALFGFTLSYDELARSSQVMGATNTLPLDLRGLTTTVTTPIIYALGTITTAVSFFVIGLSLGLVFLFNRRKF
tara:strand:+ start:538 stop:1407 length:870 start_codon:yes stop_codon:yes gene_type:complete